MCWPSRIAESTRPRINWFGNILAKWQMLTSNPSLSGHKIEEQKPPRILSSGGRSTFQGLLRMLSQKYF